MLLYTDNYVLSIHWLQMFALPFFHKLWEILLELKIWGLNKLCHRNKGNDSGRGNAIVISSILLYNNVKNSEQEDSYEI